MKQNEKRALKTNKACDLLWPNNDHTYDTETIKIILVLNFLSDIDPENHCIVEWAESDIVQSVINSLLNV